VCVCDERRRKGIINISCCPLLLCRRRIAYDAVVKVFYRNTRQIQMVSPIALFFEKRIILLAVRIKTKHSMSKSFRKSRVTIILNGILHIVGARAIQKIFIVKTKRIYKTNKIFKLDNTYDLSKS